MKKNVYNGKNKIVVQNRNFMTPNDVKICLNDLGSKKCEGFDRIPVCVLFDSRAALLPPLSVLFNKIYKTGLVPDQWKVAKITQKAVKSKLKIIGQLRILSSSSKIFEKLILKQIQYLENKNKSDLTGKQQHGFIRIVCFLYSMK